LGALDCWAVINQVPELPQPRDVLLSKTTTIQRVVNVGETAATMGLEDLQRGTWLHTHVRNKAASTQARKHASTQAPTPRSSSRMLTRTAMRKVMTLVGYFMFFQFVNMSLFFSS
jgi:hypothetical protein